MPVFIRCSTRNWCDPACIVSDEKPYNLCAAGGRSYHPAHPVAITETAERGGYDLIVVGAHGNRGFRRLLLGSVAESTVRHAHCSVLVVHGGPS